MLKTEQLDKRLIRFPFDQFLDVINTDVEYGLGLYRFDDIVDSIDSNAGSTNAADTYLAIADNSLDTPEQSTADYTYELVSMETEDGSQLVAFRSVDQNENKINVITRRQFFRLNGHNITSGVFIPNDSNNTLFSKGTFVLFANKWFIEVSPTIDQWTPFVIKDLTQLICSGDKPTDSTVGSQTNGMTNSEYTEHSSHTRQSLDTIRKGTKEPEEEPSSNSLSTILLIVGILSVIIILIIALGFVFISAKPKKKRLSMRKSSKKRRKNLDQTAVPQTEGEPTEDLPSQTSDFFEPNSGNDYSKPIFASNTKITDTSMTELGKPTDMTIK